MNKAPDKLQLAEDAMQLAEELRSVARRYHVKSDDFTILEWEIDILNAKAQDLREACGLRENLQDSTLISPWGATLAARHPEISRRVQQFHSDYAACNNT